MGYRVLLADDSLTIQKVVELTLGGEYELMAVGSGDKAVEALPAFQPDLVLADALMPGLTGYEVCEAVKRRTGGEFVPVVMLTGTFEPFDRPRAEQIGSDAIVTKPFDSQALASLVRDLLRKAEIARAAAPPPPPPPSPPAPREDTTAPMRFEVPVPETEPPPGAPDLYTTTAIPAQMREMLKAGVPPEEMTPAVPEPVSEASPPAPLSDAFATASVPPPPPEAAYPLNLDSLDEDIPRRDIDADIEAFERSGKGETRPEPWDRIEPETREPEAAPGEPPSADMPHPELEALAAGTSLSDLKRMIPEVGAPSPLTEEEIERIARRVVQLLGEGIVRKVAWEVVPEMAERLVRERLEELERAG